MGPTSPYENLAGTWTGSIDTMSSVGPATLTGTLTLNLQQNNASLTGGYTLMATRTVGGVGTAGQGMVTLTGTAAPGANPSVNFTVTSTVCPNRTADWSGSYANATGTLTITGTIHLIVVPGCGDLDQFPATILLRR
jgi:hypothetical protein